MCKKIPKSFIEYKPAIESTIIFLKAIALTTKSIKESLVLIKHFGVFRSIALLDLVMKSIKRLSNILILVIGLIIQARNLLELLRQLF